MFGLWYPLDRIRLFLSIVRLCNWYKGILLWLFLGFIVLAYSMSNIFIVIAKFPSIFFIGLYLHWRKEDQKLELELQIQNFAWAKIFMLGKLVFTYHYPITQSSNICIWKKSVVFCSLFFLSKYRSMFFLSKYPSLYLKKHTEITPKFCKKRERELRILLEREPL